ncbi:MAG: LysM peptidoglycan-binding domain-containing protein [Chloroflexota bacterium]
MERTHQKFHPSNPGVLVPVILTLVFLCAGLAFVGAIPDAQAAPAAQAPIYTPTPGPDGRIIYIVRANDTLLSISLLTGVPVSELKGLNNMIDDVIYEGQKLLLGYAGPPEVTITVGPPPTATPILPTPTPKPGKGNLCILLYEDINGDSIRQEEEPSIPDGAISFGNRAGTISKSAKTGSGLEHQCFDDLPEGEYTISIAVPEGYNATTKTSEELILGPGDITYLNFGAQANSQTLAEAPTLPVQEGQRSPLLGIVGALFLLLGVGVALFAGRILRSR